MIYVRVNKLLNLKSELTDMKLVLNFAFWKVSREQLSVCISNVLQNICLHASTFLVKLASMSMFRATYT